MLGLFALSVCVSDCEAALWSQFFTIEMHWNHQVIRMHSSRMRTDHRGRHYMSVAGSLHPEGGLHPGKVSIRGVPYPPVNRQTPLKTLPSLAVGDDIGVVVADGWCKRTLTCLCIGEVEIKKSGNWMRNCDFPNCTWFSLFGTNNSLIDIWEKNLPECPERCVCDTLTRIQVEMGNSYTVSSETLTCSEIKSRTMRIRLVTEFYMHQ